MKKIKPIPILIICTILVFLSMSFLGYGEASRISDTVPVFNGNRLEHGTGTAGIIAVIILSIYAALWLASSVFYALSHGYKAVKKILIVSCTVIMGIINSFIAGILFIAPSYDSFDNYCPEYYVVYDREKTVRLLFAEGMYYFDAKTKVYYLDDDNRAYYLGQFSAEEMLQGGEYDVVRQGDTVSFSYDFGTRDDNRPVYHNASFVLPSDR